MQPNIDENISLINQVAELKKQCAYLWNILDHSADMIFTTDTEGIIKECNRAGKSVTGYEKREIMNGHVSKFWINQEDYKRVLEWIMSYGSLFVSNYETRFRKKDGTEVDISLTLSQMKNGAGDIVGSVGICRDITEKKSFEKRLKDAKEELENFVYTISHDLKSPVVSIEGYVSILFDKYSSALDEKGRHYLNRIEWNVQRMGQLLCSLLELSRIGRVIGQKKEAKSKDIVAQTVKALQGVIDKSGVTIEVQEDIPSIICDYQRLNQVFLNLISNAIKFMGDQPDPLVRIGCRDTGDMYEFFVKDNGIGIDKKYHEKIFGLFQRLEDLKDVEGTGAGLTISKRIIEHHGGRIWVESECGQGAVFYFTLPKDERRSTYEKL